nr:glycerol-3-phosphate 1-O-acyltransferase PlsY [Clostridia bacterium]
MLIEGLFRTWFPEYSFGSELSVMDDFRYWLILGCVLIVSYLLGSVNTALVISKLLYREDIRTKGSKNAGMTNMHRVYGARAAVLTLIGDLSKTVLSVALAISIFGCWYQAGVNILGEAYLAGLFAAIGHIFPIYYKFRGGKGVLVTAVMALILSPTVFAFLFLLFVLVVGTSKYVSLGSVITAVLYPVVMSGFSKVVMSGVQHIFTSLSTIVIAILIVYCHRENLKRINDRTENKLTFKKKEK